MFATGKRFHQKQLRHHHNFCAESTKLFNTKIITFIVIFTSSILIEETNCLLSTSRYINHIQKQHAHRPSSSLFLHTHHHVTQRRQRYYPPSSSSSRVTSPFLPQTYYSPSTRQLQQKQNTAAIRSHHHVQSLTKCHSSSSSAAATALINTPFITKHLHGDIKYVLSVILALSTFGIQLEQRTTIGKALSAPLATMALSLILANVGFIPFSSTIYDLINRHMVSLAIPLLLYDSNLRTVLSSTGSLLIAFLIGAISTIIGTILAFPLVSPSLTASLGYDQGWKLACALAARHIGGAINFVAVSETLGVEGGAVSAAIAADNVVVAFYFGFLFYLAGRTTKDATAVSGDDDESPVPTTDAILDLTEEKQHPINLTSIALSMTVASIFVTVGGWLTKLLLPKGTSSLPLISLLTVMAATLYPSFFNQIKSTGTAIGTLIIQSFFAASGAAGSILLVLRSASSLLTFSFLQLAFHFISLMGLGRLLCRVTKPKELYLASNANVGGPTTAAAMAQAKGWDKLVVPAFLIGILGYATGTGIALGLGPVLLKIRALVG